MEGACNPTLERGTIRVGGPLAPSATIRYICRAAAVNVTQQRVQCLTAAAGERVVDDGGYRPALAIGIAGDAGDGSDITQRPCLDVGLAGDRRVAHAAAHGAVHGGQ